MTSRNRSLVTVAALAAIVVASWLAFPERRRDDADRRPINGPAASRIDASGVQSQPSDGLADMPDHQPGFVKHRIPLTFENARNLLALVEGTDHSHDAASLGARARALDECSILATARNYFGNFETSDPSLVSDYGATLPIVRRHVKTYLGRCVDLAHARGARGAEVNASIHFAAAAGNAWARARLFAADWRDLPPGDFDSELTSLLASRDPEVFGVVADVMKWPHPDSRFGNVSGSDVEHWAWMLAACDLGKRCGANDALMRNLCLFGGLCGAYVDLRQFLRESMSAPGEMDAIERQEQVILGF